ncbi:ABC transporter permease [Roseivirga sp. BDSF3-8]|uniref:ABC transporter permease n=1 Tax=Roseivirga sp. BDSF3-8 TaxID=3241598 RepID=UPI003531F50B
MIRRWAQRFLQWFCHPDFYDEIAGDLEELYQRNLAEQGSRANWRYALQVAGLCRPSLMRPFTHYTLINPAMFKNYLKIGTRNLLRHKLFSLINVLGLALGLTAFLLINEYIVFEKSYDSAFTDAERIYRVTTVQVINGEQRSKDAMTYHPAPEALSRELPEVMTGTVTYKFGELVFRKGEALVKESGVISADSNYFRIFDWPIVEGTAGSMLKEPNSLVLTESKARYYFGNENPVGKTIEILGYFGREFKITGVIKDLPLNTHYKFDMIISDGSIKEIADDDAWSGFNYYGFVKLAPGTDPAHFDDKLVELSRKYIGENDPDRFVLFPVQDIHLKSDYIYEPEANSSEKTVAFMKVISLLILVIAWVNYINLTTARAVNRAREVGLRKVIGAYKLQLVGQFLTEALMVNFMAAFIAFFLAELLLPYFHQLIGYPILTHVWESAGFLTSLLVFFLIGTFVSGFYPAFVLSGFRPIAVLKGKFRSSRSGTLLRKGLVISQFVASIILIAGTAIVYKQLNYMRDQDLGIDTDYVVGYEMPNVSSDRKESFTQTYTSFKDRLTGHPGIVAAGASNHLPGGDQADISSHSGNIIIPGLTDVVTGTTFLMQGDEGFMEALGMELAAGRLFDTQNRNDSLAMLVNEAFLRKMNISDEQEILNKHLYFGDETSANKFEIIGVIKDFNRTSLKQNIEPTIFVTGGYPGNMVVKLNPANYQAGLDYLKTTWAEFFPDTPLSYYFLDDRFDRLYRQDKKFGQIFGTFAALAIFIAVLGLFGLSSFLSIQRSAEVGVRKVLGATVPNILGIFYKDYLVLLGIAAALSLPLIYLSMNAWLEGYAFRISFPWYVTALALTGVVLFALTIVGYQIMKVARLDPAKTLKYE